MSEDKVQYLTQEKLEDLKNEKKILKEETIPGLAKRIDDARQMGDLSENAEYHAAREEMAWAQSRVKQIEAIISDAKVIESNSKGGVVNVGSTIKVKVDGNTKEYMIVGAQEADPLANKISNESPIGMAFLGKKKGDTVEVEVPVGILKYKIIDVK